MRVEYRPPFAKMSDTASPHVVGVYELEHDEETGAPEPVKIAMRCERCNATHQYTCMSGTPRKWVNAFAISHVHREFGAPPFPIP